jgi:hypothetical protein
MEMFILGSGSKAKDQATVCLLNVMEITSKATGLMTCEKGKAVISLLKRTNYSSESM